MPPTNRQTEITCLTSNYIEPIILLYEKLISSRYTESSPIRKSIRENGYSVSIISLTSLMIESIFNRIKYFKNSNERNNIRFLRTEFPHFNLDDKIKELYVLRDLVVHNHIWKITYRLNNSQFTEERPYRTLMEGYGDQKYRSSINHTTKKTNILGLNIIPTQISTEDVKIVFRILKELLDKLESEDNFYSLIGNFSFSIQGEDKTFSDFLNDF